VVPNHLLSSDPADLPPGWADDLGARSELHGRMMICLRAAVLPVEVIVRGYLAGSGWKDYQRTGAICGISLPAGLREGDRLPEPILTPSTKAEQGTHDENIGFGQMAELIGGELAERIRDVALRLYEYGAYVTERAGIILADTKLEFGTLAETGELILIDEILTPDSSRFWDASDHEPGRPQASYDKQFVRDWLEAQPWDKTAPGPELPPEIVSGTRARYVEAFERITGASFGRYLEEDVIAP
jgi:phosphoribosylaminoimidazole-succinocarboxamide synthase